MTESKFKVGDRVRLTGENWDPHDGVPARGEIVEITSIDVTGTPWFQAGGEDWYLYDGGYEAELVTEAEQLGVNADEVEDFSDTVKKFASGGYTTPTTGHPAGLVHAGCVIPMSDDLKTQAEKFTDAINPGHYQFPGGVEVIDITRYMDFLTGNAVKYLTRAGRKGDRLEDLKKAARYVQWAIEDAEAAE